MFYDASAFSQTLCWTIPAGAYATDMVGVWVVVGGGKRTRTKMRALHGYHPIRTLTQIRPHHTRTRTVHQFIRLNRGRWGHVRHNTVV